MSNETNKLKLLEAENKSLINEIQYLRSLLEKNGIEYSEGSLSPNENIEEIQPECVINENITVEQIDLFITLFHGRTDVYARRFISKAGNVGYSPACSHFWQYGLCPKREGKKTKCFDCPNRSWIKLNRRLLREHLEGNREDATDVIGVYPMLPDETCFFLVFDFDNHDKRKETDENEGANTDTAWIEDVNAMRQICINNGVDVLVERSRSGKGAHVWLFFESPIAVSTARRFGMALLTKGAESVEQKNFKSYDRMLPVQDKMPVGGLGNLIALPMQGQALRKGNSAFIDIDWRVVPEPWNLMKNVKKLTPQYVDEKIKEWTSEGVLGILATDLSGDVLAEGDINKTKPWEKKEKQFIIKDDIDGVVNIVSANQLYVEKQNIKARTLNRIRRLAAFSNPEFYKNMAMGFSTNGIPRIIQCSADTEKYICLPRGCEDKVLELFHEADVAYHLTDQKEDGRCIKVNFIGELYPEQLKAAERMPQYHYGILGAATGFGKTVIGAWIVAECKVNELILVHNREIMKNWINDLESFLEIEEPLPTYQTKRGIRTRKSLIGKLYGGHDSLGGIVDVAMITSFGKNDLIDERIKDYGLVLVDECHHAGAQTHEAVIREIQARRIYGMTATPKREDGLEQKVFMQLGPVRYRLTAKDRAKMQDFNHYVYPRFTSLVDTSEKNWSINVPIDESVVLVAIGKYIGEGFNYPRLDTMMLAAPISWQGKVEQYAGRLHRDYEGKKEVIIYDYVDSHVRVLERMYHKRLRTYKKIGYEVCLNLSLDKQKANAIFDM